MEKETGLSFNSARLSIEVTTQCNSRCYHCFVRPGNAKFTSLSIDLVKNIITEGYNTGYRHLHITGGEPLLFDGLFVIMDYAFSIGYKTIFMNTNGMLLSEGINIRLAAYDCLTISVSLEGTEAFHDYLRGEGSYRWTFHGIEKALNAGIKLVIFTTACKSMLSNLPHFADEVYKRFQGIKYLTFIQLINIADDTFMLSGELLEPEDFLHLVKIVSLLNLYGLKTYVMNDPLVNVVSKLIKLPRIPQSQQIIHGGNTIVRANGDIGLSHSNKDSLGKYKPGMIKEVLASDEYQKAITPDLSTCPFCKFTKLCKEYGMVRPSEWSRDTRTDIPYCRRVLDMLAP